MTDRRRPLIMPDVTARHRSPHGLRTNIKRMAWAVVEVTVFRCTWPTWYGWRARLLRLFGADVHPTARIRRTCRFQCPWNLSIGADTSTGECVWFYCLGPVTVGERVTLSHFAMLCAGSHEVNDPQMKLLTPPVRIANDAWVATSAFVGPGVTVAEGAVLGACGVAMKDLAAWTIHAGNPAAAIRQRTPF